MADELEGGKGKQGTTHDGSSAEVQPRAPVVHITQETETQTEGNEAKNRTDSPQQKAYGGFNARVGRVSTWLNKNTSIVTTLATVVMAVTMIIYTVYARRQWEEMKSSGGDTHNLALAAKTQSEQAIEQTAKMAESLRKTDDLIRLATEQAEASSGLAIQAKRQADAARDAMASTVELAQQDRRPWVGLRDFRCDGCISEADGTRTIGDMFGVMENTGKTPAVKMVVSAVWTDRKMSEPIPDYDSVHREMRSMNPYEVPSGLPQDAATQMAKTMAIIKKFAEPPEAVLPPNATRTLPIIGRAKMGRNIRVSIEDRQVFYVVGKITYRSTWDDKEHTTKFCLMNEFSSIFRFCPSGNSMD